MINKTIFQLRRTRRLMQPAQFWIAIWLVVLVLLAACAQNETGAAVSAPENQAAEANAEVSQVSGDPCSLLTEEEVSSVLGTQVTAATPSTSPQPNCSYTVGSGRVTVWVINGPSAKVAFEAGKTLKDVQMEPVPDVGDEAYWTPDAQILNVLKGDTYFMMQFISITSASLDEAKTLALQAAERVS